MATEIKAGGAIAWWDDDNGRWKSSNKLFESMLNREYQDKAPPPGANPFPAGVAVQLAQELLPDVQVLQMDEEPTYDVDVKY